LPTSEGAANQPTKPNWGLTKADLVVSTKAKEGLARHRYTKRHTKRDGSIEVAQPAIKKAETINSGTWLRFFAEVVKGRNIIGLIDQGVGLPRKDIHVLLTTFNPKLPTEG